MLDFAKLKTPPGDGEVLVDPAPGQWRSALEANARSLRRAEAPFLGATLTAWRAWTRERILGKDGPSVVALGHQPEFIHCGVWAKHVVARRFAEAVGGAAVNLVVDNDSPRGLSLRVPVVQAGRAEVMSVSFGEAPAGRAYEQAAPLTSHGLGGIEARLRERISDAFDRSMMPVFLGGIRRAGHGADWVEQMTAGRRAVDTVLDCAVEDRRVSRLWWTPLLLELTGNVPRFAASYNRALADYRLRYRVRGDQRPIPDLAVRDDAYELPFWAYRAGEPRRRVFAATQRGKATLFADRLAIGTFDLGDERTWDELTSPLEPGGDWRIRPRALALTIWARVFLCDLFIHGIGGAKYDRISDVIISDYFGIAPPHMACVSATLRLALPRGGVTHESVATARRSLRDAQWNPHRHWPDGDRFEALAQRRAAVERAVELRERRPKDRAARRQAFEDIRRASRSLLSARPDLLAARRAELDARVAQFAANRIALDREFFYALHTREALRDLAARLPLPSEFRV